jgi:hypothetical protein
MFQSRTPTKKEHDDIKRKVELMESMLGSDPDLAFNTLVYLVCFTLIKHDASFSAFTGAFAYTYTELTCEHEDDDN